ncbi:MAG: hypothetical protein WA102_08710 [Candidatus Methanoperedens sp.]
MQYSTVFKSKLDDIVFRLDAEYYHPACIDLENKLQRFPAISLRNAKAELDCSAFYPSIVSYYNFKKDGIPFIRVNEIQNGLLHLTTDTVFLPEEILDNNKSTIARGKPRDLIIAKGGNTLAKIALLTDDYSSYSVCRDIIILKTSNLHQLNKFYLWIFLHSDIGQKLLLRTASQTGQPHLTVEAINNIKIPTFSDVFQDKFEGIYRQSQEFNSLSQKRYHETEVLLLFELGLLDWKPKHRLSFIKNYSDTQQAGRFDAEYFQPKYDEIVAAIKNYKGGWDTLGNLASLKKCIEVGSEEYSDEGIPFVRVSNLSPFETTEEKYISEKLYSELTPKEEPDVTFEESKNHQPKKGEILFSKDATPGIAYFLSEEPQKMIPSGGILRLKLKDKQIKPSYLTLVLNSLIVQEQINRDVGGSVILHWRPDQVEKTLIPILKEGKQDEIQQKITESFSLRKQSKQLLECAKKAVEMAIEKDEETAMQWLDSQIDSIERGN